jgi:hypothetical protein
MKTQELNENTGIELASSNEIINIQIIIDTDKIISDLNKKGIKPSQNKDLPTGLDHSYQFMVASTLASIKGQGTADLEFKAEVGDVVRFNAISEYNNMDNAVLMYNIKKFGGTDVFNEFSSKVYTKKVIQAASGTSPLPPTFAEVKFWFYESSIAKSGTEDFNIHFALYTRVRGQENPVLYGYFYWDPRVVVKF